MRPIAAALTQVVETRGFSNLLEMIFVRRAFWTESEQFRFLLSRAPFRQTARRLGARQLISHGCQMPNEKRLRANFITNLF